MTHPSSASLPPISASTSLAPLPPTNPQPHLSGTHELVHHCLSNLSPSSNQVGSSVREIQEDSESLVAMMDQIFDALAAAEIEDGQNGRAQYFSVGDGDNREVFRLSEGAGIHGDNFNYLSVVSFVNSPQQEVRPSVQLPFSSLEDFSEALNQTRLDLHRTMNRATDATQLAPLSLDISIVTEPVQNLHMPEPVIEDYADAVELEPNAVIQLARHPPNMWPDQLHFDDATRTRSNVSYHKTCAGEGLLRKP